MKFQFYTLIFAIVGSYNLIGSPLLRSYKAALTFDSSSKSLQINLNITTNPTSSLKLGLFNPYRFEDASNQDKDRYILSPAQPLWHIISITNSNGERLQFRHQENLLYIKDHEGVFDQLRIQLNLKLPHLMGLFGYKETIYYLSNRYLPLPHPLSSFKGDFDIQLFSKQDLWLYSPHGNEILKAAQPIQFHSRRIPPITLSDSAAEIISSEDESLAPFQIFHWNKLDYEDLLPYLKKYAHFLKAKFPNGRKTTFFLESNLIEGLVISQQNMIWINQTLYHTNLLFKPHHTLEVLKVYTMAFLFSLDGQRKKEHFALAEATLKEFIKYHNIWKLPLKDLVEKFSFLPSIDRFVYDDKIDFKNLYLEDDNLLQHLDGPPPEVKKTLAPNQKKSPIKFLITAPWIDYDIQSEKLQFGQWMSLSLRDDPYDRDFKLRYDILEEKTAISSSIGFTPLIIPVFADLGIEYALPKDDFKVKDEDPKFDPVFKLSLFNGQGDGSILSQDQFSSYLKIEYSKTFVKTILEFILQNRLARYLVWGGKVSYGKIWGKALPHNQIILGGFKGVRGFTKNEVYGSNTFLATSELRFPLKTHINFNLWNMIFFKNLVGVLFYDGAITDTTRLSSWNKDPIYYWDMGIGLRNELNVMSVRPRILSTDIAFSPGENNHRIISYHIKMGHSF